MSFFIKKSGRQTYGNYILSKKEWILCGGKTLGLVGIINYLCYRSVWIWLCAVPCLFCMSFWERRERSGKRKRMLRYHFTEVLQSFQNSLRVGISMENAVGECRREMERTYGANEDFVKEFRYMEKQMKIGVPLDRVFLEFGKRSEVEEILWFGEVFSLSKKAGGNIAGIMEQMGRVLGDKIKTQREIDTCIAAKKLEQTIMSIVPGGMILYVQITSPGFMDQLYHNALGAGIMTLCLILYGFSFWLGRKIVRIEI